MVRKLARYRLALAIGNHLHDRSTHRVHEKAGSEIRREALLMERTRNCLLNSGVLKIAMALNS